MLREIYGKKIGMTQLFDEDGTLIPVSAVSVEPACILEKVSYGERTLARIGCFKIPDNKIKRVKKPQAGYFKKLGTALYKLIREVPVLDAAQLEEKKEVGIELFEEGTLVDVRAKNKGRGFQGGMRRHGWHGQPRSHGSTTHRRLGSAGACTFPGRIIKGINMPGHMGNAFITVKNLKIVKIDKEKNILFVKGAIPGPPGAVVCLKKVNR